ncbi:MAG: site-2 protease family protein [Gemmatimonadota bacterium]
MTGVRIGRIFGIDVHVHASWLIIAGLVMWSLLSVALPADFPDVSGVARIAMATGITLLFFLSLLAHELAHSVVAIARGIPVHRITFFLFGGMAQTSRDSRSAREEFLIAIAGPLMSFVLAGLALALWYGGTLGGWGSVATGTALYVGVLNLVLGIFNLLPGFPMDGGRVLRAAIWKATGDVTKATRWAARIGAGMAILLMVYGFWRLLVGDVLGGIWMVFIALFVRNAARSSYRQHLMSRMHDMARERWESRYHRHPFGPDRPGAPLSERPGPAGPPGTGRDVTHLGRGGL